MGTDDKQDKADMEGYGKGEGMKEAIQFDCEVRQIKTMVDHSFNLTLNIPEYNLEQVQELMGMLGDMVGVAMVEISNDEKGFKKYQ